MLLHVVDLGENLKIRLDMKSANTFTLDWHNVVDLVRNTRHSRQSPSLGVKGFNSREVGPRRGGDPERSATFIGVPTQHVFTPLNPQLGIHIPSGSPKLIFTLKLPHGTFSKLSCVLLPPFYSSSCLGLSDTTHKRVSKGQMSIHVKIKIFLRNSIREGTTPP
ncbi:hypothetical protein [Pseudomonas viridiflava]|uniref:hypothetical protein n=1 Tax=Pseudomonas viridiflava TaxID=33069 RepID=UPI0013CED066|nr:hypothetical protein [Pseudomonas viridiflava]